MTGFAVIDVETTGLSARNDRIIEIAVVHVDTNGTITGNWETLINPERNLAAQHIHHIHAHQVLHAPRFTAIAQDLEALLSGRVPVAHNAPFDARFITAEFQRTSIPFHRQHDFLCTMQLSQRYLPGVGKPLADCCAACGITINNAHTALADATATAQLLATYLANSPPHDWEPHLTAASHLPQKPLPDDLHTRWYPRNQSTTENTVAIILDRLDSDVFDLTTTEDHNTYLTALEQALSSGHLSDHDAYALADLARNLGMGRDTAQDLHRHFYDQHVADQPLGAHSLTWLLALTSS
ncbi:3'-5' exonuclease [Jonesia quinghaiensis]|uniref:3'-5' exonuclease n=1 Tax=Jonesia quinghaiensis TaxID=262806 RepID=UPI000415340D|nr:3'-5' exonuclease [Jonesia quinghaiensis]